MRNAQMLAILEEHYDAYGCGLNFENPYQFPSQQDAFAEAVQCTKALL